MTVRKEETKETKYKKENKLQPEKLSKSADHLKIVWKKKCAMYFIFVLWQTNDDHRKDLFTHDRKPFSANPNWFKLENYYCSAWKSLKSASRRQKRIELWMWSFNGDWSSFGVRIVAVDFLWRTSINKIKRSISFGKLQSTTSSN